VDEIDALICQWLDSRRELLFVFLIFFCFLLITLFIVTFMWSGIVNGFVLGQELVAFCPF